VFGQKLLRRSHASRRGKRPGACDPPLANRSLAQQFPAEQVWLIRKKEVELKGRTTQL
jgi:hypothetical protein